MTVASGLALIAIFEQWNVYDYVNTQLTHNKTYAYRLPLTYINRV
jgi:hypothetical protein